MNAMYVLQNTMVTCFYHFLLSPSSINAILIFLGKGLHHIAYKILSYLDAKSLCRAEQVCVEWSQVIADGFLWKKLIERKTSADPVWKGLSERRGWSKYLFRHVAESEGITHLYYRQLYPTIIKDIEVSEEAGMLRCAPCYIIWKPASTQEVFDTVFL